MTRRLQYWFDFSCPYAYLASTQVEGLAARTGAELDPRPMLLGGVFRAHETPQKLFATLGAAKARHNAADMARYAALFGVRLEMPGGHPLRTVMALRALLVVGAPFLPLAHRFFAAYWARGIDLSTKEGVARVLSEAGHDPGPILEKAESPEIKDELRRRTDEAIALGIFGAPAFVVDEQLYFGQDRLDLVERALGGTPPPLADPPGPVAAPVDVWFDYSSPFSYFGWSQIDRLLPGVARPKPMLLGAVFKEVGQVNVPLLAQSPAKQRYIATDTIRQAEKAGVPFAWPTRFPMNTVLALRLTIAAEAHLRPEGRRLITRFYRAYWAEDLDLADPAVLAKILAEEGYDAERLLAAAQSAEVKEALRSLTGEAVAAGVFGAPTFVVQHSGRAPSLYWGSDRIELAALSSAGLGRID